MDKPQQIDWKPKKYASKRENYNIYLRIADLKSIVETQCSRGNYDTSEYMRGMANGLLLAWHILIEPYGTEVPYFEENVIPKEEMKCESDNGN
jgi:hypothetical protein